MVRCRGARAHTPSDVVAARALEFEVCVWSVRLLVTLSIDGAINQSGTRGPEASQHQHVDLQLPALPGEDEGEERVW